MRVFYLQQSKNSDTIKSLASVALERISGILSAVILLIFAIVLNIKLLIELNILIQLIILLLIFLIISWCVLSKWPVNLVSRLKIKRKWFDKMVNFLNNFYREINFYKQNAKVVAQTVLIALILQLLSVIIFYCATKALGVEIKFMPLLFISPIVVTVSLLPVTINGLGLAETTVFFLYTSIGLTGTQALSSALAIRVINILISLIGLRVYLKRNK